MKKKIGLKVGDKVRLLDGRVGTLVEQNTINSYYFTVRTHDGDGKPTYFKIFHSDMQKISPMVTYL